MDQKYLHQLFHKVFTKISLFVFGAYKFIYVYKIFYWSIKKIDKYGNLYFWKNNCFGMIFVNTTRILLLKLIHDK